MKANETRITTLDELEFNGIERRQIGTISSLLGYPELERWDSDSEVIFDFLTLRKERRMVQELALGGMEQVTGDFYVVDQVVEIPGSRWEPPSADYNEVLQTRSLGTALEQIFVILGTDRITNVIGNFMESEVINREEI
jgi:hypothetical protein